MRLADLATCATNQVPWKGVSRRVAIMTRNLGIGLWSWISFRVVRASRPCLCWCRPVGCVSCVGRWCGRTCPANTPGVGSWYGALVLVCSAAGSFARGGDAIQAASHTLRRGAAFRVAWASRPCWWDCATFQVALPRARSIWLSAVDDGAGAIGGGDPSLPVVFDAALDETDAQSSLLNLSDRSQPSSCHRSHEMDM